MKKYLCPIVKVIELDMKQAVLQVCETSGIYMYSGPTVEVCYEGPQNINGPTQCAIANKGISKGTKVDSNQNAFPS